MAGDTIITVIGNVTADPELRFTPSGQAVANFTIASTSRVFDKQTNEWKDGDTLFLRCSVWRTYAENVAESLTKGMQVIAQGRLVMRPFEDREGNKRTSTELHVEDVGPTLRWATAKVTRSSQSGGQQRGQSGGQSGPQNPDPWGQPGGQGGQQGGRNWGSGPGQQGGGYDPWGPGSQAEEPPF